MKKASESRILVLTKNNPNRRWMQLIEFPDFPLAVRTGFVGGTDRGLRSLCCAAISDRGFAIGRFCCWGIFKSSFSLPILFCISVTKAASPNRPLKDVFEAAGARQKQAKKRSLCMINEHFESVFNTAAATQIVFQRPAK